MKQIVICLLVIATFFCATNESSAQVAPQVATPGNIDQGVLSQMKSGKQYYQDKEGNLMELNAPLVTFENHDIDFGDVPTQSQIPYHFVFRNTGTSALTISDAWASCDCTDVFWPVDEIPPGAIASIHVVVDTKDLVGKFFRTVTFAANTPNKEHKLFIKANIVEGLEPLQYPMHETIE